MTNVRIRPEGRFWVAVIDGCEDDRLRFPSMDAAVDWAFRETMRQRPLTISLEQAPKDELVLCER